MVYAVVNSTTIRSWPRCPQRHYDSIFRIKVYVVQTIICTLCETGKKMLARGRLYYPFLNFVHIFRQCTYNAYFWREYVYFFYLATDKYRIVVIEIEETEYPRELQLLTEHQLHVCKIPHLDWHPLLGSHLEELKTAFRLPVQDRMLSC